MYVYSVILGIGLGMGVCCVGGWFWSSLHAILPFIIMGIGLDDMFVLVHSFEEQRQLHVHDDMEGIESHIGEA